MWLKLQSVQQIVGHEKSQLGATKHYDKGAWQSRLFEEMRKVDYGCLELENPIQSWEKLSLY